MKYRVIVHKGHSPALVTEAGGSQQTLTQGNAYDIDSTALGGHVEHLVVASLSGPTANRPAVSKNGDYYADTTLSKIVFADGNGLWYDPFTGGAV